MKAMILAAGLGTRLRPLTDNIPKALVELNGRTLLEITIERLKSFGVTEIIVNVHHHAEKIAAFLKSKNNFAIRVELSREDDLLLDTGGGLKKAVWFFQEENSDEPFLLHNVDVLTTIDFRQMLAAHKNASALATLAVQQRPSSRQLLFDQNNLLAGRSSISTDEALPRRRGLQPPRNQSEVGGALAPEAASLQDRPSLRPLAFSGIHVISPRLLNLITESGAFSIIDTYLRLSASNEKISAFRADSFYWRDLGRPEDLRAASTDIAHGLLQ
jgi:NDP-sugar pyrophosphorylase family protein